ncbi:hypothetical protein QUC31_013696 [Theobroma cacao]
MFLSLFFLFHLIVPGLSEFLSCASSTTMSPDIQFDESKMGRPILSRVSMSNPGNLQVLKTSACIFTIPSNSTFTVSPGPVFVRLHFYPISYPSLNLSKALFNVSIGSYTLLSISKSSYSKGAFDVEHIIKEYCVPVEGHVLNILFTPSSDYSDAYGFVNMIEVVSVPPKLYIGDLRLPLIGHPNQSYSMNYTALETFYRVNVGGSPISGNHDTGSGMSRSWSGDQGYLLPNTDIIHFKKAEINFGSEVQAYTAPKEVYSTARKTLIPDDNLTWSVPVDSGFCYLIRLHLYMHNSTYFMEENQMVVHIYSPDHAEINLTEKLGVSIYRDYLVNFSGKHHRIMFLTIAIQQNKSAILSVPILNGLEIFKLSDDSNSLAGPNPFKARKVFDTLSDTSSFDINPAIYTIIKVLAAGLFVIPIVCYGCLLLSPFKSRREEEHDKVNLAEWAIHCYQMGTLDQSIDPSLLGQINPECFQTFTAIARKCLADKGSDRPSMGEVLCNLELAWQQEHKCSLLEAKSLQGRANEGIGDNLPPTIDSQRCLPTGNSDPTPGAEFSEIIVPIGR